MTGAVYFLQCEDRIKVGYSHNPGARVKELATGAPAPVTLLAMVRGPRSLETNIHRRLRDHRVSGEWFRDCRDVRALMDEVLATGECEPRSDFCYPELMAALRRISEPNKIGTKTSEAIDRTAERVGLPRWRIFDIWYGKARRVEVAEALAIQRALITAVG